MKQYLISTATICFLICTTAIQSMEKKSSTKPRAFARGPINSPFFNKHWPECKIDEFLLKTKFSILATVPQAHRPLHKDQFEKGLRCIEQAIHFPHTTTLEYDYLTTTPTIIDTAKIPLMESQKFIHIVKSNAVIATMYDPFIQKTSIKLTREPADATTIKVLSSLHFFVRIWYAIDTSKEYDKNGIEEYNKKQIWPQLFHYNSEENIFKLEDRYDFELITDPKNEKCKFLIDLKGAGIKIPPQTEEAFSEQIKL